MEQSERTNDVRAKTSSGEPLFNSHIFARILIGSLIIGASMALIEKRWFDAAFFVSASSMVIDPTKSPARKIVRILLGAIMMLLAIIRIVGLIIGFSK